MRRRFVRGLTLATGGSVAVAVVGLLRNVLIARVMGPGAYGLWQWCLVALRFAPECHLGALHAQALDVPPDRVRGASAQAEATERGAQGIALVNALVLGAVAAVLLRALGGSALGLAAPLLGAAVVAWQAFHADAVLHRSRAGFGRLAVLQVAFAAAHVAALLWLVPRYYVSGALGAWIVGVVVAVAAARAISPERVPLPRLPGAATWKALVGRGGAAYLVDLGLVAFLNLDRVVVGTLLGSKALGHYGVLSLAGAAVLLLPDVVGRVLWPYAGERYGLAGRRAEALGPLVAQSVRGLAPAAAVAAAGAAQATDVLVAWALPAFEPAAAAVRCYLPAMFLLALCAPLRILLVTAGAGREVLRLQGAVMFALAVAQAGAVAAGWGIEGVAAALSVASAALFLLLLARAAEALDARPAARRLAGEAALLLAASAALDFALRFAGDAASLRGAALRLAIPAVLGALAAWAVLRRGAAPDAGAGPDAGGPGDLR